MQLCIDQYTARWEAAVEASSCVFDEAAGQACIDGLSTVACDDPVVPDECSSVCVPEGDSGA